MPATRPHVVSSRSTLSDPNETDDYEAGIRSSWMRTRAALGTLLLSMGCLGIVGIPVLVSFSSDSSGLLPYWGGAVAAAFGGWTLLRHGTPEDMRMGPVPLRFVIQAAAPISLLAALTIAWPLGVYRAVWVRASLAGTDCDALLPLTSIETLNDRPATVTEIETADDRCAVELESASNRDVASLRLEVTRGGSAEARIRRLARRPSRLPELGDDAWIARLRSGTIIAGSGHGRTVLVQLSLAAWSEPSTSRLVAHLREALEHLDLAAAPPIANP